MTEVKYDVFKNVISTKAISAAYDNWLTGDFLNHSFRSQKTLHPSDLAVCPRKAYRLYIGYPGIFYAVPKQQRTFQNGHDMHARYQKHLGEMGILKGYWECLNCNNLIGQEEKHGTFKPQGCSYCGNPKKTKPVIDDDGNIVTWERPIFAYHEVPVSYGEPEVVNGHTDGIIDVSNKKIIIDFKTCSRSVFTNIVAMNKPIKYHVKQVNIYMYLLGIDHGCLLYESKDTMEVKEFYFGINQDIINEFKDRVNQCLKAKETGVHPDIPEEFLEELNKNVASSIRFQYEALDCSCKGYYGYPPCPFFHDCYASIYNAMGGAERLCKYKDCDGELRDFIKTNKRVDPDE